MVIHSPFNKGIPLIHYTNKVVYLYRKENIKSTCTDAGRSGARVSSGYGVEFFIARRLKIIKSGCVTVERLKNKSISSVHSGRTD